MNVQGESALVLVVDDDREMVSMLADVLGDAGYRVATAHSGDAAVAMAAAEVPDLIITDLRMGGMSGHQLQREMARVAAGVPIIVITAFGSIQNAVESMRQGAFDYLTKPFSNDELLLSVERGLKDIALQREVRRLREELAERYGLEQIVARNPRMAEQLEILKQVADSNASVLLTGESGVGKDLLARALHYHSARHGGPFVALNCAAIPDNLLESELFGYVRGAFTDARQGRAGLFEAANGGTMLLDEIGEMPLVLQAKLLRVLEDRRVRPIGATAETAVDVRIVAATNAPLEQRIASGRFRADLYYRIATVVISVPPLRERPEDLQLLIQQFLVRACRESGRPLPAISADAMQALLSYRWPGNARELYNAIHRAVLLCRDGVISRSDLPQPVAGDARPAGGLEEAVAQHLTLEQVELEYIRAVLNSVGGNRKEAAALLGIDRKTLYRRLGAELPGRDS